MDRPPSRESVTKVPQSQKELLRSHEEMKDMFKPFIKQFLFIFLSTETIHAQKPTHQSHTSTVGSAGYKEIDDDELQLFHHLRDNSGARRADDGARVGVVVRVRNDLHHQASSSRPPFAFDVGVGGGE